MGWTQPICVKCWNGQVERGEREGRIVLEDETMDSETEVCCYCEQPAANIYIRVDPSSVPHPQVIVG